MNKWKGAGDELKRSSATAAGIVSRDKEHDEYKLATPQLKMLQGVSTKTNRAASVVGKKRYWYNCGALQRAGGQHRAGSIFFSNTNITLRYSFNRVAALLWVGRRIARAHVESPRLYTHKCWPCDP